MIIYYINNKSAYPTIGDTIFYDGIVNAAIFYMNFMVLDHRSISMSCCGIYCYRFSRDTKQC